MLHARCPAARTSTVLESLPRIFWFRHRCHSLHINLHLRDLFNPKSDVLLSRIIHKVTENNIYTGRILLFLSLLPLRTEPQKG